MDVDCVVVGAGFAGLGLLHRLRELGLSACAFEAGADERRFGNEKRHALALHVGSHECPVCVVVFEERDQTRGNRDNLFWRDVHVLDFVG